MVSIKKGSGNVFTDLGFGDVEAQSLQRKVEAIIAIERAMRAHRMSQAAAAKIMNVSRGRLNQMLRGKVEGVTFDRILQMADAIGVKAKVNYKQPQAKAG
jgi:predicted XRE-type DNA-binding protein